jgi:predicted nucleic acid-binding protein
VKPEDERVEFVAESDGPDNAFPLLVKHPMPTPKLVADAYLAAFAISARRRLVTLDAGFRQFSRLDFRVPGQ